LVEEVVGVDGMSCGHCKMRVENALNALQGVSRAEVDLESKTVTVRYDSGKTERSQITEAIEAVGYGVRA
jgi:copper chaperone